jgi:hypothetical protein
MKLLQELTTLRERFGRGTKVSPSYELGRKHAEDGKPAMSPVNLQKIGLNAKEYDRGYNSVDADADDLHEAKVEMHDAVLKAIAAALDRTAVVRAIDVDNEEIFFTVGYDFPEHRTGKIQEVRAAFRGAGKVDAQKGGDQYDAGIDFQLTPKTPMSDEETASLKSALKSKYKDAD